MMSLNMSPQHRRVTSWHHDVIGLRKEDEMKYERKGKRMEEKNHPTYIYLTPHIYTVLQINCTHLMERGYLHLRLALSWSILYSNKDDIAFNVFKIKFASPQTLPKLY